MTADPDLLRLATEAHYEDPHYYDQTYRRRREDVRFYADLAERYGGPVLELGVGSGRVALAIAERGIDVVGVDTMAPMLDRFRERLEKAPHRVRARVTLRKGDLRSLRSKQRFPLIVAPFHVFMHLYERRDVERALATVSHHLRRGGRFAFDVRMPDLRELERDPARIYRVGTVKHPANGRRYKYREQYHYDPVRQVQLVQMIFQAVDDPNDWFATPLAHRHFFPAELEALLHYAGFAVEASFGDFDQSPLDAFSEQQILIARRGRARR